MFPRLIALLCAALIAISTPARAGDLHVVLELRQMRDGEVTSRLTLHANQVDPNISAVSDKVLLTLNGKTIHAPKMLLTRLNQQRRGYSYDSFTRGIEARKRQAMCMMAGPALGDVLHVRYLTYKDHQVVKSEMRPVYAEAENCLFGQIIHPRDTEATIAAAKALASLQTLRAMAGP